MKNKSTELVFIIDKSGSMSGLEKDTIGGFNSMIKQQKKGEGECFVTTVLFNGEHSLLHDRLPVEKVRNMTERDYTVCGCTALYDAVGSTIEHVEKIHKYIRREDIPSKVMFVITTDGMENASKRFGGASVKSLIEKKKKEDWEFIFIGANIDAFEVAEDIGIGRNRAANYVASSEGTSFMYSTVSDALSDMRENDEFDGNYLDVINLFNK